MSTEGQRMKRVVTLHLPLPLGLFVALTDAVTAAHPDAKIVEQRGTRLVHIDVPDLQPAEFFAVAATYSPPSDPAGL